jgi:hypothetical protein
MKTVVLWLDGLFLALGALMLVLLSTRGARIGGTTVLFIPCAAAWAALYFRPRMWFFVAAFLANALMAILAGLWFVLLQHAERPESSSPFLLRMTFLAMAVVSIANLAALWPYLMRKSRQ